MALFKTNGISKTRFYEVDSLRGIAAIAVLIFHFTLDRQLEFPFFKLGVLGVDLFFIISGFVIFQTLNQSATGSSFLINRFSRLFPTYWTCVFLTSAFWLIRNAIQGDAKITIGMFIGNLTMIQRYFGIENLDEAYWTLKVELVFYFFMLIVFKLKGMKQIELIGLAMLAGAFFYGLFWEKYAPQSYQWIGFNFPLIRYWPLFFGGILLNRILFQSLSNFRIALLFLCLVCLGTLFDDGGPASFYMRLPVYLVWITLFFLLFFGIIHNKLEKLNQKHLLFLGAISYPLYLIHQFLGTKILIPGLTKLVGLNYFLAGIVATACSIAIATAINHWVEKPFTKMIRKSYSK